MIDLESDCLRCLFIIYNIHEKYLLHAAINIILKRQYFAVNPPVLFFIPLANKSS